MQPIKRIAWYEQFWMYLNVDEIPGDKIRKQLEKIGCEVKIKRIESTGQLEVSVLVTCEHATHIHYVIKQIIG